MITLVFNPTTSGGAVLFDEEGHATMALLMKRAVNTLSNTPKDVLEVSDKLSATVVCPE